MLVSACASFYSSFSPLQKKTKKTHLDRSRYKKNPRQSGTSHYPGPSLSSLAQGSFSGFSLTTVPERTSLSRMYPSSRSLQCITWEQRRSFDQKTADKWFDGIPECDKERIVAFNLSTIIRVAGSSGSSRFENQESLLQWAQFLVPFSSKLDVETMDLESLYDLCPSMLDVILPKLSPNTMGRALGVAVARSDVLLVQKLVPHACAKIVGAQNSLMLQKLSLIEKNNRDTFLVLFDALLPKSNWKKAVKDLIHKGFGDLSDVLLTHPSVPIDEVQSVLQFAKYRGVLLPLAEVRYDRHVLTQHVQHVHSAKQNGANMETSSQDGEGDLGKTKRRL